MKSFLDLLFNLVFAFMVLFFVSFVMINDPKEEDAQAKNDNHILITMNWETNNDMDLWLRLPDGRKCGYSARDIPPAHLDVDVVAWRRYTRQGYQPDMSHEQYYDDEEYRGDYGEYQGEHEVQPEEYVITENEEIITVRNILAGEYAVNVHYFSDRGYGRQPIKVKIMVQDIRNKSMIWAGEKEIDIPRDEVHFVKFTVVDTGNGHYKIEKVYTDRPTYFVGKKK